MQLSNKLRSGILIKRYKRFLADVDFNGEIITVHCPNPGAMTGVSDPGLNVWCSQSDSKNRKYKYTLELVEINDRLVGVNTMLPNKIVLEALENKKIPSLAKYNKIKKEFLYEKGTRFDFLLSEKDKPPCIVEVKNVQLRRNLFEKKGLAEFPDSITSRGAKHLKILSQSIANGYRALMLYVVQRQDCEKFSVAKDIDPIYAETLEKALYNGVETEVWVCDISLKEIKLSYPLKIHKILNL